MPELTLLLDPETGGLLLQDPELLPPEVRALLERLLGPALAVGCARPPELRSLPEAAPVPGEPALRVAGYYHGSLVEGPGRRSCVLLSGCLRHCPGCWVPQLHSLTGGTLVSVEQVAKVLLEPGEVRDGVSLLGGEPFLQPEGLLALVRALRARGCPHILVYTGYTYEELLALGRPAVDGVLGEIDLLIDGPFRCEEAGSAGPWTGSGNQRVIDLAATRREGRLVLLSKG